MFIFNTLEFVGIFFFSFIIAIISSSLGIGGGIFTVPMILYLGKIHSLPDSIIGHIAIATSLLTAFLLSFSASLVNYRKKLIFKDISLFFLFGGLPGVVVGVVLTNKLDTEQIKLIFGMFVLLVGIKTLIETLLSKKRESIKNQKNLPKAQYILLTFFGFLTSILSTLTGTGGGVIMIPLFSYFRKNESFEMSIATSTFVMTIMSLFSSILFFFQKRIEMPQPSIGYYYLPFVIPSLIGSILGGAMGANLKSFISDKNLKLSLSILQIFIGIKVLFF
ncbi:MAG: sulfite exporter TauE/SafE family protein [Leptospiraceae bacterium]|nr:sulfite exporter TauE/SafE family protein [Leptospiraceae bacterium]MDW7975200.1 sulfite exporter TauE/SafE family protein [Leptospiraceae bacterium]